MSRWKPRTDLNWSTRQGSGRRDRHKCDKCQQGVAPNGRYLVVVEQTSWFRGDDEVTVFCAACAAKAGYVDPKAKKEVRSEICPA